MLSAHSCISSGKTVKKFWRTDHTLGFCVLTSLSLLCTGVWAQDNSKTQEAASSGGLLGIGVSTAPVFMGSDEFKTSGTPLLSYEHPSGFFLGGSNGLIGMRWHASPRLQWGTSLNLDGGRKESDSRQLRGMGDIDAKATANVFVGIGLSDLVALNASVSYGAGNAGKGALFAMGASFSQPIGPSTLMSVNLGATFANFDYAKEYFGVSVSQSKASGYRAFTPEAGPRDLSISVGVNHQITPEWLLIGNFASATLTGDAKNSPLVRKAITNSAFVGVAYTF